MKQSDIFLEGEGKAWLDRNKDKLGKTDPVMDAMDRAGLVRGNVLEIGCSDGWRLRKLHEIGWCAYGVDPLGHELGCISRGTADDLPHITGSMDVVIYGFCLYLCDREDLFKIASEGDRVLKDGGYLIIYDFANIVPVKKPYHHKEGVFSYKMEHERLWLWNPAYSLHSRATLEDNTSVVILHKRLASAWPNE